jgi:MFS family permease
VLYRFANASMLPLVSENLGNGRESLAALIMAVVVVVPQIIVAIGASWAGHYAEQWGRKPVLLIGFGLEPLRGVPFAHAASAARTRRAMIGCGLRIGGVVRCRWIDCWHWGGHQLLGAQCWLCSRR